MLRSTSRLLRGSRLTAAPLSTRICVAFSARHLSSQSAQSDTPATLCDAVIIGGGIIGCSTAFHLASLGQSVILLEKSSLTSGTTWHAAGLMVTFGSLSHTSTDWRKYTKELYSTILPDLTGLETGFKQSGFIELATTPQHLEEYRRISAFNRYKGIDVQELSPAECLDKFPLLNIDDVLAGFYVPTDGRVNPVDACMAYARAARNAGASLRENTPVKAVLTSKTSFGSKERACGVLLEDGTRILADNVVNCAGMWAHELGLQNGITIPNQAAEHYYLITDEIPEVDPDWPVVEDPSSHVYIRPEGGGLMLGLFEPEGAAWNPPEHFSFGEITPDWDRMAPYLEKSMARVPRSLEVGAKTFFCGPESFTPDNGPIVGESPELPNYYIAAGLNSVGILSGGGVGRTLATWIHEGSPDCDVTGITPARFQRYQNTPAYREERVVESIGKTYKCHYPNDSYKTARGAKQSPIGGRIEEKFQPFMRDVSGWESPMYYDSMTPKLSFFEENYHGVWREEHEACRESVGLIDMSFMSKFLVQGRDAGKFLNTLSTADVDSADGTITYTQWLDESGKMQADLTVTRLSATTFMVVATDTQHRHVEAHMQKRLDLDHMFATITDVTGAYAFLNVQGPRSRELLEKITTAEMGNEAFEFGQVRELDVGYCRFNAARITYAGELGYELYVPSESAVHVYDRIVEAGEEFGLRHVGLKALGSLRLEKGYRDFGHDMDNTDTLLDVGLSFTADMQKEGGFVGKESVEKEKAANKERGGRSKRLASILVEGEGCFLHGGDLVERNGVVLGEMRVATRGWSVGGGRGIGLVMLDAGDEVINMKYVREGEWKVRSGNELFDVEKVTFKPLWDPKNERIKA